MSRNKTQKFALNKESENIIQEGKELFQNIKGQWREKYFKNQNPLVLELGCGWGEYTIGLAENFPNKNFIGIDIKGDRLYKGSQIAQEKNLSNVAFLRTKVHDLLDFFSESEVDEIWITFPDPRPKKRDQKRRMTHPRFMKAYYTISKKGSLLHLKTDNTQFFEYTLEIIDDFELEDLVETKDLNQSPLKEEHFGIQTKYEKIWSEKGSKIKYLRFKMI